MSVIHFPYLVEPVLNAAFQVGRGDVGRAFALVDVLAHVAGWNVAVVVVFVLALVGPYLGALGHLVVPYQLAHVRRRPQLAVLHAQPAHGHLGAQGIVLGQHGCQFVARQPALAHPLFAVAQINAAIGHVGVGRAQALVLVLPCRAVGNLRIFLILAGGVAARAGRRRGGGGCRRRGRGAPVAGLAVAAAVLALVAVARRRPPRPAFDFEEARLEGGRVCREMPFSPYRSIFRLEARPVLRGERLGPFPRDPVGVDLILGNAVAHVGGARGIGAGDRSGQEQGRREFPHAFRRLSVSRSTDEVPPSFYTVFYALQITLVAFFLPSSS